jgi:hypothetical protein
MWAWVRAACAIAVAPAYVRRRALPVTGALGSGGSSLRCNAVAVDLLSYDCSIDRHELLL